MIRHQIPFEWFNGSYNFITYWGDILPGRIVFCPNYESGFFILPTINQIPFSQLGPERQNPEEYRKLGWEINDPSVIMPHPIPSSTAFGEEVVGNALYRSGDFRFKKMFVFGAGASANCVFGENFENFRVSSNRPPNGAEIFHRRFDSLLHNFPGAEEIIPFFEHRGWDIERALQEEWDQAIKAYNPQITTRHINIQYYLSELFRQISGDIVNNYKRGNLYSLFALKLQQALNLDRQQKVKAALVSFNYDTILDEFISSHFRINYKSMDEYINWNKNPITLFKPHGSWQWGWTFDEKRITTEFNSQKNIANALYREQTPPAEIYYNLLGDLNQNVYRGSYGVEKEVNPNELGRFSLNKRRIEIFEHPKEKFLPALLVPYGSKDEFVMPYQHFHALSTCIAEVEDLYLIGWKGSEAAFNRQLEKKANSLKRLIIVNPDADNVINALEGALSGKSIEIIKIDSFEKFVREDADRLIND